MGRVVVVVALTLASLPSLSAAGVDPGAEPISYTVAMPNPVSHFFDVEVRVSAVGQEGLRFAFPAWMPGGYLIREVAADVLGFRAEDGVGRALPTEKVDKQTWEIPRGGDDTVVVRYRLFADERGTPYSARLNADVAHMNLVRVLGYVVDRLDSPAVLTFVPWGDWRVATSLEPVSGRPLTFQAPDYDVLGDGIALLGHWHEEALEAGPVRYRMVFSEEPDFRGRDVVGDVRRIAMETSALFGDTPFDRYLFLYVVEPEKGRGGIEHLFGTSIGIARSSFGERDRYLGFLGVTAHELIHAWNVKRMRPRGLGPFDYAGETYTRLLYVAEGFTTYYGFLVEVRSEAITRDEYFEILGERILEDRLDVGIREKSLEQISWDSWMRSRIPFLTFRTYYRRGALVALMLDLEIRQRTGGRHSLDDVMRLLYGRNADAPEGFTDEDLRRTLVEVGGAGLDEILDNLVQRPGPIDIEGALAQAGLEVLAAEDPPPVPHCGIRLPDEDEDGDPHAVMWVEPGSPAEVAGLQSRDALVAVAGRSLDKTSLEDVLAGHGAGETVDVTFFRDGALQSAQLTLGDPVPRALVVRPRRGASEDEKALLEAWLAGGRGSEAWRRPLRNVRR